MPDFLNTADLQIHQSLSEQSAGPTFVAIARADAVAWSAIPSKYRKLNGNTVEEMTAPEKATVDAAEAQAIEDKRIAELEMKSLLTAQALVVLDAINVIRAALVPPKAAITKQQFADAVRAKYKTLTGA